VRAIKSGDTQAASNSIGGFRVGTEPEQQMASYINANISRRSSVLTDNAQTFGVILLTGRPEVFFDRVDRGDGTFEQVVIRPHGRVTHLLMAKLVSGDLIRRRYPTASSRVAAGLTPVSETERYLLLEVAGRDPRRTQAGSGGGGGTGGGIVGGRATGATGGTPGP